MSARAPSPKTRRALLRYYVLATLLVVGLLVVAAQLPRSRTDIDVSGGPKSTGTPSVPRPQPTTSLGPQGVQGEAPWAFSALPECFEQEAEAHGPIDFVRAHVPAGMRLVASPSHLETADCTVQVLAHSVVVDRGTERLEVPPETQMLADDRHFGLLCRTGATAVLRVYHLPSRGRVNFIAGAY